MSQRFILAALALVGAVSAAYDYCQADLPVYIEPPFNATLSQVAVVTRHGDRTPLSVLPRTHETVQWNCDLGEFVSVFSDGDSLAFQQSFFMTKAFGDQLWRGNCTPGQLTLRGAQQHKEMGKRLREIYIERLGLLPKTLSDPSTVFVRSTDVFRTRQSAMSNMYGLYPPGTVKEGVTIPLRTAPSAVETLHPNGDACPALKKLQTAVRTGDEWKAKLSQLADVRERLEEAFGTTGMWEEQISGYADILHGRKCNNLDFPVSSDDAEAVWKLADWEQTVTLTAAPIPRLSGGFFLKDLVEFFTTKGAPKYGLFSAHDSSVTMIMTALGFDEHWPPYASSIVFELWRDADGGEYVRIIYNGELRILSSCSEMCPLTTFKKYVAANSVTDVVKECQLK